MADTPRNREQVIENTREMLAMAEAGFALATGAEAGQRRAGLMNLITYGRSVTFALQTMKSVDPDFEAWYAPYQEKMASDPLMRYFGAARNEILKEGQLSAGAGVTVGAHGPVDLGALIAELSRQAPPNTVGTFFGEARTGGDGWRVLMPDGSTQNVYFTLPDSVDIKSDFFPTDPPKEHYGSLITDASMANLGALYIGALKEIVANFEERFS